MKPEDVILLEAMHQDVQATANKALGMACVAVQMAAYVAKKLTEYENGQPCDSTALGEDLREWLPRYREIGELSFAEKFNESKPHLVRRAMKLLDVIPQN